MVFFILLILIEQSVSKSGESDQTPRSAASDLVLHCLSMSHTNDARLKWVKFLEEFPGRISVDSDLYHFYIAIIAVDWLYSAAKSSQNTLFQHSLMFHFLYEIVIIAGFPFV